MSSNKMLGFWTMVVNSKWPLKRRRIREQSGLCWAHDITRHSYGSYPLGAFRNAGDTAEQMGHLSSTSMLFRHYRRAVRQDDAEQYWQIRPGGGSIP